MPGMDLTSVSTSTVIPRRLRRLGCSRCCSLAIHSPSRTGGRLPRGGLKQILRRISFVKALSDYSGNLLFQEAGWRETGIQRDSWGDCACQQEGLSGGVDAGMFGGRI